MLEDVQDAENEVNKDESKWECDPNDMKSEEDDMLSSLKELARRMSDPVTGVQVRDRRYHFKKYKNCFVGKDAVEWLCKNESLTEEAAISTGTQLMQHAIIHHVCYRFSLPHFS